MTRPDISPEGRRWYDRAAREATQVRGAGLVALLDLNPDERDEAVARLSDGELVAAFVGTSPRTLTEEVQSGRLQRGERIVPRADLLAAFRGMYEAVTLEMVRRMERAERA